MTGRKTSRNFLFDSDNRLCGWRNQQSGEEKLSLPKKDLVEKAFSGIHILSPEIFPLMKFSGKFSIVDVYLDLAASHLILGYDHSGSKLVDVGKPDSIQIAESLFP